MGNILNPGVVNQRVYSADDWNDEMSMNFDHDIMANSNGGADSSIEDSLGQLASAAKMTMKKRTFIYDWKTSNRSFIQLHKDLRKIGIKNNKFFMKLYDRDLIKTDPFNPILPQEIKLKMLLECIVNPWYFLREVCRIPVDGMAIEPGGGSPFLADRNNIASWYCFLNGIDHYDSKSRQLGKTQNAVAELNYTFHFGAMSATFLFFSKDFPMAKQNLYRLKCQRDMLPTWMQMRLGFKDNGKVDKGQDSVTIMRNPITNNVIKVMPRATSRDAAVKLGRGETSSIYWNDEYDFTPYNNEIMDAAAFAFSTASKNAKKNRSLYGRILTSTPGYLNTQEGKDAEKRISRMLVWEDAFYDKPIAQIHQLLDSNKCNGFMYVEHSWKQLKKGWDWYESQCKLVDYDSDKILREIELKRIQGNELSPFKKANLSYIARNQRTPIERLDLMNNLQPILIYKRPNKHVAYIIAVDPAEGLGLNNNAFVLLNPHTQMVEAEFKSPYISPVDFHNMLELFMDRYCPRSMVVIEANRGRELINRFMEGKYRYHLWYDAKKLTSKVVEKTDQWGSIKQEANQRRALGFDTTPSSRPLLFSIIERLMEEELDKCTTEYLVKDIASVQRKPNGSIILGAGDDDEGEGHGDVLMAFLIGMFVLYNAKNLEEFGIYPGASEPDDPNRELTDGEKREKIQSIMGALPDELQDLFKDVLKQTDPVQASFQYEKELQREMRSQEMEQNNPLGAPERSQLYVDPGMQDSMWDSINTTISDGYYNHRNDPSRQFNVEDYV